MTHFIIVTYDISDDKRRAKLHNALLDFGTPVQYSVFECRLDAKAEKKMRQVTKRIIRPRKDNIRYYYLCEACLKRVETIGGPGGKDVPGALPPAVVVG